jgi:hypothetical protein
MAFGSSPVSMCNNQIPPHPQHDAMQILVHVDVALHRKIYFLFTLKLLGGSVALPSTPIPYKKSA